MTNPDIERLKADASGNTGLSEVLAEAVRDFSSRRDAVRFLASRGFEVSEADLADVAADEESDAEDGYGTLVRFLRQH